MKVLWTLGLPSTLGQFCWFLPNTVVLWMVRPLGAEAVATVGMGLFFVNVTGLSMVIGFGIGMVPLASQAFGAKNYKRVGVLLQRQQLIHLALSVPVLLLWWNAKYVLQLLGQPSELAESVGHYLRWRIPGLPFMVRCVPSATTSTHVTVVVCSITNRIPPCPDFKRKPIRVHALPATDDAADGHILPQFNCIYVHVLAIHIIS
jgi:hypothetical protein